ncbi:hypothetical protein ACFL1Q_00070 [Patescibacteria group bacterium]
MSVKPIHIHCGRLGTKKSFFLLFVPIIAFVTLLTVLWFRFDRSESVLSSQTQNP